jgi:hypothetical protein
MSNTRPKFIYDILFFAKDSTLELTRSKVKKEILFYDEMFLKFKCLKDLKSNHLILNLLRPFNNRMY